MNSNPTIIYLKKHWRGELSLSIAFWLNFVLLNILLRISGKIYVNSRIIENPLILYRLFFISLPIYIFILYPWQLVGMWRCAKTYIKIRGKYFWARCVQIIIVLNIIRILLIFHFNMPIYKSCFDVAMDNDIKPNIKLEKGNTIIHLKGKLGYGTSNNVCKILKKNPEIRGIIIDSTGGKTYEGRRLAKLISHYNLNTYSFDVCYSAANTAFIAGKHRYLGAGAIMGFHKCHDIHFKKDSKYYLQEEDKVNSLVFKKQGIKEDFIKRMYASDELWYPTTKELFDARVINGIVNGDLEKIKNKFEIIDENEVLQFQPPAELLEY
ncbi:MAG: hypothetical protein ABFD79_15245 [Phycisphaerales bacterium]